MTDSAPNRSELLDLYKISIEEYRFQAQFNWNRTQYWLVFNIGILAAGTALLKITGFAAAVFLVGVVAAVLSVRASQVAHGYYRQARDWVRRIEATLSLDEDFRFDTTPGLAGRRSARINVSAVNYLLLGVVAVADAAGVLAALMIGR